MSPVRRFLPARPCKRGNTIEEIMQGPTDARMYPPESEREDALVRRSEIIISSVLRGGVILSATVIAIGVAAYYLAGASAVRYPHGLRFPDSIATLWVG